MSTAAARLALTRLDDRAVPSTVTSTATARPLDFTATGTLSTTTHTATDTVTETDGVTLAGHIDYASATEGGSGAVSLSGTGSGTLTPVAADSGSDKTDATGTPAPATATTTTPSSFTSIVQGQLGIAEGDGTLVLNTPLTGTAVRFSADAGTVSRPVGPLGGTGSFDVSNGKLNAALASADGQQTGTLAVTLTDKTTAATDLAFTTSTAAQAADGSVNLDFTIGVTGKLMTAASHTAAATHATAVWSDGAGRTAAADLDVPVAWNAGAVAVTARGLTAPSWATSLVVTLDPDHAVTEKDETNNTWTVTLAGLPAAPPDAGTGTGGTGTGGTGTGGTTGGTTGGGTTGGGTTTTPTPVAGAVAGYSVQYSDVTRVQWQDANGNVLRSTVAFDGYSGPVTIGVGDVNGDGVPDVAVGAGAGGGPRVRVLDGATGRQLADTFAYESSFRGGVDVAVGDLDGDGKAEVVVGAGQGGGPHVVVLDGTTGAQKYGFMAYEESARGGVSVAVADLDGDGKGEIVTAAGPGGGPVVAVFDGTTGADRGRYLAGDEADRGGLSVAAAKDKTTGHYTVTTTSDETGAMARFRQQLQAGEDLLVRMADPLPYPALYAATPPEVV